METINGINILAIESKPENLMTLGEAVREALPMAVVLTALDGSEGIELAAVEEPDVILLDIGMVGFEVCRRLKDDERLKDIPVIFLTSADTTAANRVNALEAGSDGFLCTPLEAAELIALIRAIAKRKSVNRFHRELLGKLPVSDVVVDPGSCKIEYVNQSTLVGLKSDMCTNQMPDSCSEQRGRARPGEAGALEALRDSEIRYRRLFESAKDGILILDAENGMVTDVNPYLLDLLGYSRTEVIRKKVWELGFLEDVVASEGRFADLRQTKYVRYDNLALKGHDGRRHEVEFVSNVYQEGSHEVIQCNIRDISERKRAEEGLKKSEWFLRSTLDGLSAHIAVLDDRGEIILTNKAYRDFWKKNGIQPVAVAEGTNYLTVCYTASGEHSQEAVPFAEGLRDVLSGKRRYFELEYPCHSPDEKRWFVGRVMPSQGEGHRRVVVVHENITERRRAEEKRDAAFRQLRTANRQLESSNRQLRATEAREAHLKRVLLASRNINQLIVHEDDPQRLIAFACENLTGTLAYFNAWIKLLDGEGGTDGATACAGLNGRFEKMGERLVRGEFPACMRRALETDAVITVDDPYAECTDCPLTPEHGGRAGFARRLAFEDRIYGVLAVSVPAVYAGDAEEQGLFDEMADDLGFALRKIDLQAQLRRNEQRLRLALKATNDVVWDWDMVNDSQRWNEAGTAVFGWTDIVEAPQTAAWWLARVHPEDRRRVEEKFCAAVIDPSMELWNDEYRFRRADGAFAYVVDRGHILRNADGRGVRMIGAMLDITDRKRAEETLRENEARLRGITDSAQDAILMMDPRGAISYWNPAAVTILGYRAEEAIGRNLHELLAPERFLEDHWAALPEFLRTGQGNAVGKKLELAARRKDGQEIITDLSLSAVSLRGEWHAVGILRDITDRKRMEVERENLQAQLRQAQKMEAVGRLAGGVAHDFNNMLGIILGYADMILEKIDPDQPLHADLTEIRNAGARSADLTRQLLAFARKQTVAPKVVNLNETLEGMLKMLHRLIGEDIDMAWIPGEKVWLVKIDPGQVDQILANLSLNARDAIAGVGKLTIETGNTVFDEAYCKDHEGFVPGDYVMLAVSDNGCGMDSETMSHLFEPFFTTKELGKGTGLGLATVYGVVKQNHGFINVYSEPGQGTTFKIYLPRHLAKVFPLPDMGTDKPSKRCQETVLLVEDEPAILKMITRMLEREGYTVVAAGIPGEAIRLANEHGGDIHLLMSDVVMPEMNGRDLAKNILSLYPHIKCLFMSGYTANVIAYHGVLDEGVNFIQKPFSKGDLTVKVREVLDRD